jgi:hypothetical protein
MIIRNNKIPLVLGEISGCRDFILKERRNGARSMKYPFRPMGRRHIGTTRIKDVAAQDFLGRQPT